MNWKLTMVAGAACVLMAASPVTHAAPVIRVPTGEKVVALTFDDGPSATFTPIVLNILRENHAKATFFVIGSRVEKLPQLLQEELQEHDEIANHSFQHQIMTGLSERRICAELANTQHAIERATGTEQPRVFRPPRGRVNKKILRVAEQNHYTVVMWSIESGDWANPGVRPIVKRVLSQVKSGDIVLFHDQGGNRSQTVDALKQVLPALRQEGYQFVTVSELLTIQHRAHVPPPRVDTKRAAP